MIAITAPGSVKVNQTVEVSARLTTATGQAVGGRQVTFYAMGAGYSYLGLSSTDNNGTARVNLRPANLPLQPGTYWIGAQFTGSGSYGPAFPAVRMTVTR